MNNPFSNPAFSMAALTAAINILPNRYGRLEELNLMPPKPVRQRQIVVEEMNGVLNLLPTLPPGSPGTRCLLSLWRRGVCLSSAFMAPFGCSGADCPTGGSPLCQHCRHQAHPSACR